jgi:hypothetical protein
MTKRLKAQWNRRRQERGGDALTLWRSADACPIGRCHVVRRAYCRDQPAPYAEMVGVGVFMTGLLQGVRRSHSWSECSPNFLACAWDSLPGNRERDEKEVSGHKTDAMVNRVYDRRRVRRRLGVKRSGTTLRRSRAGRRSPDAGCCGFPQVARALSLRQSAPRRSSSASPPCTPCRRRRGPCDERRAEPAT